MLNLQGLQAVFHISRVQKLVSSQQGLKVHDIAHSPPTVSRLWRFTITRLLCCTITRFSCFRWETSPDHSPQTSANGSPLRMRPRRRYSDEIFSSGVVADYALFIAVKKGEKVVRSRMTSVLMGIGQGKKHQHRSGSSQNHGYHHNPRFIRIMVTPPASHGATALYTCSKNNEFLFYRFNHNKA